LEAGDRFGEYVILKRLAAGGMAEVYLARKKSGLGGFTKPVAMKVILPHLSSNERFVKMFLDEARLAVFLDHAHIAQTLDLGEVDGQYFIAMEFAHGEDLQRISVTTRKSGRLLPLPYAAKILSQIAEGLYYAHTKTDKSGRPLGIVHRDISPHNIILTFDGLAKLIDFGVAKARVTFQEEEDGVLKGKFSYMSPEQIRGMPIDPRSDIFALGIVLWEVCTGAHLYRESSELLTMEAILRKPVPKPRDLRGDMPPDLEAIILKALAKRSVDRFQTAYEMHQSLEGYLNRSGWSVGTPHLSEFMKKLFPEEYAEIRDLLAAERQRQEAEAKRRKEEFVPWEPYENTAESDALPMAPAPQPVTQPRTIPPRQPERPTPAARENRRSNGLSRPMIVIILLLVLLCAAGAYILVDLGGKKNQAPSSPLATSGTLKVISDPPGAEITLRGQLRGKTPATIESVPFDEDLTLRIEKKGYEVYIAPVRLSAGNANQEIKAKLKQI
jgi:eukaryotic-like serine/threonine-protein kinase